MKTLKATAFQWFLDRYKRNKQRNAASSIEEYLAVVRRMFKQGKYGFLITHGSSEWQSARLVQPIVDDEFQIWIGTNPKLRKAAEVCHNPHVTFAIEDRGQDANLVVYGTATLEKDPALRKRFWKPEWHLFFPGGPLSDEYILIKVVPQRMELMNFAKNVVLEPFGLKPVHLSNSSGAWTVVE